MMKSWGLLALRIAVGIIFMYMGYSKLVTNHTQATAMMAGIFGGSGSGLAYFVGLLELVGGAMVLLGIFATYAAVWLAIIMVVAILAIHMGGPASGYFLALSMLGSCLAIIGCGAGKFRLVKMQCHCKDCSMGCGMNGGSCGTGGTGGACCGGSGACGDKQTCDMPEMKK